MNRHFVAPMLFLMSIFAAPGALAEVHQIQSKGLVFTIDDETGAYALDDGVMHFAGRLPGGATAVSLAAGRLQFQLARGIDASVEPAPGSVRALLFGWRVVARSTVVGTAAFPDFTEVPAGLHSLSHRQVNFAPPVFDAAQNVSTPWVLFNESGRAWIVSPASNFFIASMLGDARHRVAVGLNGEVRELLPGFAASSLIAAAPSVSGAYAAWGTALRALYGRLPANPDADATLRMLGELTDNAGGHYYYNYEYGQGLNYEDSLVRFVDRSRAAGIPFGYLQLDSWWYAKSSWNPHEQIGRIKNPALPDQDWNRYGGLLEWRAQPGVFPKGMAAFHDRVNLPFLAHNRFIDKDSAYRQRYEVSGLAAVDPGYWEELASYAKRNGIEIYLQDWLDAIYKYSPELHSVPGKGEAFLDGMADAMRENGLTMQYCMAYPLHMLQGVKYSNLTTIRAAGDGLSRDKWTQLVFNAPFIRALGAWPASDVFGSGNTDAMLFAVLSGGPVGIGDAFEQFDRTNIFRAVRADGRIIKPDEALAPLDRSYLTQARASEEPILAAAFTRHGALSTAYLLAFADAPGRGARTFSLKPAELGFEGPVAVLDPGSGVVQALAPQAMLTGALDGSSAKAYRIVAPVTPAGIAVFGDLGKFVPMGRAHVAGYASEPRGVKLTLDLAAGEHEVTISGYASASVAAQAEEGGVVQSTQRDPASGLFTVHLRRTDAAAAGSVTLRLSVWAV